ncbi:MAG: hypothetical protein WB347_09955 [Terriglobales bacterium]
MTTKLDLQIRMIATLLTLALLLQPAALAAEPPAPNSGQQTAEGSPSSTQHAGNETAAPVQPQSDWLPDSPGALQRQSNVQQAAQPPQQPPQNPLHEPVGTAAAEWMPVTGVAASRPAGAALAPAKQRRARSVLIKVGALLGAGAAVGTVMALSAASPSKPPGSH